MKMGSRAVSAESVTESMLKLIVWEFFCTLTWDSRARSCVRKRRVGLPLSQLKAYIAKEITWQMQEPRASGGPPGISP